MEDEFDKLMTLFAEDSENREKKLAEIFERSIEFFDKYKHVLRVGSEGEKAAIQKKMAAFRERLKEENEKNEEQLGISSQDIKELASKPEHFTPEQWEFIKKAEEKLALERAERAERDIENKQDRESSLKGRKKNKPTSKKSDWLKS